MSNNFRIAAAVYGITTSIKKRTNDCTLNTDTLRQMNEVYSQHGNLCITEIHQSCAKVAHLCLKMNAPNFKSLQHTVLLFKSRL